MKLDNISLCAYIIFYVSRHPSIDMWVVSTFWLQGITLLWTCVSWSRLARVWSMNLRGPGGFLGEHTGSWPVSTCCEEQQVGTGAWLRSARSERGPWSEPSPTRVGRQLTLEPSLGAGSQARGKGQSEWHETTCWGLVFCREASALGIRDLSLGLGLHDPLPSTYHRIHTDWVTQLSLMEKFQATEAVTQENCWRWPQNGDSKTELLKNPADFKLNTENVQNRHTDTESWFSSTCCLRGGWWRVVNRQKGSF